MGDITRLFVKDGHLVNDRGREVSIDNSVYFKPEIIVTSDPLKKDEEFEPEKMPPGADAFSLSDVKSFLDDGSGRWGESRYVFCYAIMYYRKK